MSLTIRKLRSTDASPLNPSFPQPDRFDLRALTPEPSSRSTATFKSCATSVGGLVRRVSWPGRYLPVWTRTPIKPAAIAPPTSASASSPIIATSWERRTGPCLPQSVAARLGWPSSRPVGNEAEQYVYVSAFDLDRQLSCPRVHDDDRRRRVFLFCYAGKPHRVTDIIKLIAENSVDSNLVRTLNKLRRAQVHRRGSGWRTFELTASALAHKASIFLYCLLNCSTANLKRRGSKANIFFRASYTTRATRQQMARALRVAIELVCWIDHKFCGAILRRPKGQQRQRLKPRLVCRCSIQGAVFRP